MNQRPAVSVVTPTKNRLDLLCEAIESVRAQSLDAWEHIIVDDGSNDGTREKLAARAVADPRIRYVERTGEKTGANVCRNLGIRTAKADLIVLLDSDDLLKPFCLEHRVEMMRRNLDLDFAVSRAGVFSKTVGDLSRLYHNQDPGDDLLRFLSGECPWQTTGPIWRRDFLTKIGLFDETLLSMQDLEMHARALCARGRYICHLEVDHDIRWQHDYTKTSVRHFREPAYIEAADRVRMKLFSAVSNSGLLTWSRQRALLGLSFTAAESWVRSGRLGRAMQTWARGCREHQGTLQLRWTGFLMLCVRWLGAPESATSARLINKWKGWVRFRQEPALVNQSEMAIQGGAQ